MHYYFLDLFFENEIIPSSLSKVSCGHLATGENMTDIKKSKLTKDLEIIHFIHSVAINMGNITFGHQDHE